MYIGRTHSWLCPGIATFALLFATGIITSSPVFAQSVDSHRLSSHPNDLHDAFAIHPEGVQTPEAFAQFVASNQKLAQRYARHFQVPQDRLVSFFKTSLIPLTLPERETLTTYGVDRTGTIYPVKTTLPKGSRVWATREGVPVLKWNCSNPLVNALPGSNLITSPLEYATLPESMPAQIPTPGIAIPDSFAVVGSPLLPDNGDSVAVVPQDSDASSVAFSSFPGTETFASSELPGIDDVIEEGTTGIGSYWPALLIPIALLVGHPGDSDHSDPYIPVPATGEAPPLTPGNPGSSIVPEASTILYTGIGTLGLLALAIPKKRRN